MPWSSPLENEWIDTYSSRNYHRLKCPEKILLFILCLDSNVLSGCKSAMLQDNPVKTPKRSRGGDRSNRYPPRRMESRQHPSFTALILLPKNRSHTLVAAFNVFPIIIRISTRTLNILLRTGAFALLWLMAFPDTQKELKPPCNSQTDHCALPAL